MIFVKVGGASIVKVNNLGLELKKRENGIISSFSLCGFGQVSLNVEIGVEYQIIFVVVFF